uniref:Uncharacterized protein n=1 Tax=Arundo donax TaxID=35708 RepID=A0A0A9HR21_ARUDO
MHLLHFGLHKTPCCCNLFAAIFECTTYVTGLSREIPEYGG